MKHRLLLTFLALAGKAVLAATISFTGTFQHDDDIRLFQVTLNAPRTFTAHTLSFAGGVNAAGTSIGNGGFSPVLSLFDATGFQLLLATDFGGGLGPGCGGRAIDPLSGFCWDASLSLSLNAGTYWLALTEDDNQPFGPTLADGFLRQGQGDFTGPNFTGSPGSFVLINGQQRNNTWAVDIDADSATLAPEPAYGLACGLCLTLAGLARQRFNSSRTSRPAPRTANSDEGN